MLNGEIWALFFGINQFIFFTEARWNAFWDCCFKACTFIISIVCMILQNACWLCGYVEWLYFSSLIAFESEVLRTSIRWTYYVKVNQL